MKLSKVFESIEEPNYMVIQNLKQIESHVQEILSMNQNKLQEIMKEHPWAVDHLTTSKDDIEEVYNFLKNRGN